MTRENGSRAADTPDVAAALATADAEHAELTNGDATAATSASDTPPKRTRTRKPRSASSDTAPKRSRSGTRTRPTRTALAPQLEATIASLGLVVGMFQPADGEAIMRGAAAQARALDQLAKTNPNVERVLRSMVEVNAYGSIVAAFAPTVLAILSNHGKVNPMLGQLAGAMFAAEGAAPTSVDLTSAPADASSLFTAAAAGG